MTEYLVSTANARQTYVWMKCGGIDLWASQAGDTFTTAHGARPPLPNLKLARTITDLAQVFVIIPKVLHRVPISKRTGDLDQSEIALAESLVETEGPGAWLEIDRAAGEVLVLAESDRMPLSEYVR